MVLSSEGSGVGSPLQAPFAPRGSLSSAPLRSQNSTQSSIPKPDFFCEEWVDHATHKEQHFVASNE